MVKRSSITTGLGMLCTVFGREPDEKLLDAWVSVLAPRFHEAGWEAACNRILKTFQPTSAKPFPVPADFLAPAEQADEAERLAEAGRAFAAVLRCTDYNPNSGTHIDDRLVLHRLRNDAAALAAYDAMGGEDAADEALHDDRARGFVRNRFCDAYKQAARARDGGAELPPRSGGELPPGRGEAKRLMRVVDPDGKLN